jgi:DNA polymerase I-like protein with 3'-5' exonuclease and polymerase domains
VQNFPRPNGLSSENTIRACIIADPGHSFLVCDYGQIELVGFAHVLNILGEMNGRGAGYQSSLARAINANMDGHIMVAAEVLRTDYDTANDAKLSAKEKHGKDLTQFERAVAKWRQVGKIQNYGAAGGMGAATFVAHASKQDAVISQRESEIVREAWLRAWSPDVPDYFKYFGKLTQTSGRADITQLYSGRLRGKATFTQCCNTMFQALCADGAKYAMSLIIDACYLDPTSPLYGCTPVLFVHDEFVLSCPHGREKEAGAELSRLMIKGMARYISDIKIEADCAVMARWGKG